MKFLFVIDSLGSGGAQRQMVTLALGLKARGHNIEFFVYYPQDHYRSLLGEVGITVHSSHKLSRFSIAPFISLHRLIRQHHFDIVLSFLDTPNFYAEIATIGLSKTKLVVSYRTMYQTGPLPLKFRLFQESHRLANFITVNSYHQRERMIREFPWMKMKSQTIYNGFDLDTFFPIKDNESGTDELRLLAISSVSFNKNSLNLARALVVCHDKYQLKVHVDWIGTQKVSGEGTRPSQLTDEFLREKGFSKNWKWLGEITGIPKMLATHDALIHPSYLEGLPNVVCEALACGRPVLVSNVCDHPILVQNGKTGYLFDPDSPEDIARSIYNFSRLTPLDKENMGRESRGFAEKNLSLKRYVDEYEQLFASLVE